MSIITLTTDFGLKDHFVGALKGKILTQLPNAQIIDISHEIDLFNISEASYVVRAGYYNFPSGTVHLIGVDSERTANTKHLVVFWNNHYFVCADNGIMSLVCQNQKPQTIIEIDVADKLPKSATDLDVLLAVACHIAKGGQLDVIGKPITELKPQNQLQAVIEADKIRGNVIYFDHFGNCITNITKEMFEAVANGRNFEIQLNDFRFNTQRSKTITKISRSYADFTVRDGYTLKDYEGEKLALFNEAGYLEIAIYKSNPNTTGTAKTLFGLKFRDVISVVFK
ncbi:SAM hydrolase/SAM-dependent halogenase family protein [Flavobacterium sp.]|uniref:SAM hydrolase/SAM-dependent halogenase family protein n=1 Tax=Flavobacterium sp. TaxID=239 RepID=UPI003D138944